MIQGVATQHIAKGANGVQVVAVSKDIKYRFKEWNDNNSREAARIDKGVNTNITAKAIFETFKYELKYEVTEGGEFTPATIANKTQQVVPSENGTAVEVQAKAGYYFVGWSDGKTELMRTDLNIRPLQRALLSQISSLGRKISMLKISIWTHGIVTDTR